MAKKKTIVRFDNKKADNKTRGVFSFIADDGTKYKLSMREKQFCELYLQFDGNGTDAIIEAGYNVAYANGSGTNRKMASVMANENLSKPKIYSYINKLLHTAGFNDENVTKQHLFLINQHGDLAAKKGGVEMYYKLKGKFAPDKIDVRGFLSEFDEVGNDDIAKAASSPPTK